MENLSQAISELITGNIMIIALLSGAVAAITFQILEFFLDPKEKVAPKIQSESSLLRGIFALVALALMMGPAFGVIGAIVGYVRPAEVGQALLYGCFAMVPGYIIGVILAFKYKDQEGWYRPGNVLKTTGTTLIGNTIGSIYLLVHKGLNYHYLITSFIVNIILMVVLLPIIGETQMMAAANILGHILGAGAHGIRMKFFKKGNSHENYNHSDNNTAGNRKQRNNKPRNLSNGRSSDTRRTKLRHA